MRPIDSKLRIAVSLALFFCVVASSCGAFGGKQRKAPRPSDVRKAGREAAPPPPEARAAYGAPILVGAFENRSINESSGVVASRTNASIMWTHNDSGEPFLFAFNREGKHLGVWRVKGATLRDWEDLAQGPGPENGKNYLYIGDIGDNDYERSTITVYRVPEPTVTDGDSESSNPKPRETTAAETIKLKYPDGPRDAETLLVHPQSGDIYIVAKSMDPAAGVYKLSAPVSSAETQTLTRIGEVKAPGVPFGGFFTGGAFSIDGTRLVLCDYVNAYEFVFTTDASRDSFWKQTPLIVDLGERKQGEAVCYAPDGKGILGTNEGRNASIVEVRRL